MTCITNSRFTADGVAGGNISEARIGWILRTVSKPMDGNLDEILAAIAEAERGPTDEELSGAPIVNHYRLERTGEIVHQIYGQVQDHPEIRDPYVTTTPLFGFDPDAGWARTRSRWYRLGPDWLLPNPDERDEMARAIQMLLRATRKWVADELHDDGELKEVVEERRDVRSIRFNIDDP